MLKDNTILLNRNRREVEFMAEEEYLCSAISEISCMHTGKCKFSLERKS